MERKDTERKEWLDEVARTWGNGENDNPGAYDLTHLGPEPDRTDPSTWTATKMIRDLEQRQANRRRIASVTELPAVADVQAQAAAWRAALAEAGARGTRGDRELTRRIAAAMAGAVVAVEVLARG